MYVTLSTDMCYKHYYYAYMFYISYMCILYLSHTLQVVSVNFHPFFRNEKDPVKKKAFYTNYIDVNLPVDIFTQVNTNITKVGCNI